MRWMPIVTVVVAVLVTSSVSIWASEEPTTFWREDFTDFDPSSYYMNPSSCSQYDSDSELYVLAAPSPYCTSRLFLLEPVEVREILVCKFSFRVLRTDEVGADGFAFTLADSYDYDESGTAGSALGIGANPGFFVIFDTYFNMELDPAPLPHVRFARDSVNDSIAFMTLPDIVDGSWHDVFIVLRSDGRADVTVDHGAAMLGVAIGGFDLFPFSGFIGFTAATGGDQDRYEIDNIQVAGR